jgi:hypothetical protein
MVEKEPVLRQDELPDFGSNWRKIKDQLPRIFAPSDWKDVLDTITLAWRDCGKSTEDRVALFVGAITLPGIPKLELAEATEFMNTTRQDWDKFVEGVKGIVNGVHFKWSQMRELSALAEKVKETNVGKDNQTIALLQAISQTRQEGKTPPWIRQRIAQHAFDEIVNTGIYRVLDYSGPDDWVQDRTTEDGLDVEKAELAGALRHELWDRKTLREKTKIYKNLRTIIFKGDNSVERETADSLEKLWNAANGTGVTRKSALYYLRLAEDIYSDLQSGGAFDEELLGD